MRRSRLRRPASSDAAAIQRLIEACRPLDVNSTYAYLLLCHHFADTCVVAESDAETTGFLSAYLPPGREDSLFVWQVAVAESARGQRLASSMIEEALGRKACASVRFLEATVSPSNRASRALFEGFAARRGAECQVSELFPVKVFDGVQSHEPEELFRIGPFTPEHRDTRSAIPKSNGTS
jgi:L-2,4-diaminobutyric acid acetyltransferase